LLNYKVVFVSIRWTQFKLAFIGSSLAFITKQLRTPTEVNSTCFLRLIRMAYG